MMTNSAGGPRYSIVVPVFNEQAVLPVLLRRLDLMMADLDGVTETIFVDDGSSDCSAIVLRAKAKEDPRYRFIGLSRNFGHQAAITAGMDAASGDAVIVMDADLQDPPEVVGQMIEKWKEGYQVVYGRRLSREGDSAFKQATASLFYKFLGRLSSVDIPRDAGDFRLIDRKVLEAFSTLREKDRFVRGMFAWMGFRQTAVTFHRQPRAAGQTKSRTRIPRLLDLQDIGNERRDVLIRVVMDDPGLRRQISPEGNRCGGAEKRDPPRGQCCCRPIRGTVDQRRFSRCLHVTHKVTLGNALSRSLPIGFPQTSQMP